MDPWLAIVVSVGIISIAILANNIIYSLTSGKKSQIKHKQEMERLDKETELAKVQEAAYRAILQSSNLEESLTDRFMDASNPEDIEHA